MANTESYTKDKIDVYTEKLAKQPENYDDLVKFIKKVVKTVDSKELTKDEEKLLEDCKSEGDISRIHDAILKLVDSRLIIKESSAESKVVYYKIKGDYYKQLATSTKTEAEREEAVNNASVAYVNAQDIASKHLTATHPLKLALALSRSEFHHDIHKTPDRAIKLAQQALDAAVPEPGKTLDEASESLFVRLDGIIKTWKSDLEKAEAKAVDYSSTEE